MTIICLETCSSIIQFSKCLEIFIVLYLLAVFFLEIWLFSKICSCFSTKFSYISVTILVYYNFVFIWYPDLMVLTCGYLQWFMPIVEDELTKWLLFYIFYGWLVADCSCQYFWFVMWNAVKFQTIFSYLVKCFIYSKFRDNILYVCLWQVVTAFQLSVHLFVSLDLQCTTHSFLVSNESIAFI